MSSITPRKRSADGVLSPPPTDGKGNASPYLVSGWSATKRARDSLPTPISSGSTPRQSTKDIFPTPPPKPIFNVLPTPPRTPSHRKTSSTSNSSSLSPLPYHLNSLLSLANAFSLSLSLHLATHPPILPPLPPSAPEGLEVVLDNVATYLGIKDSVEKIAGKRFGLGELKALLWLWEWDGNAETVEGMVKGKGKSMEDNPFLVSPTSSAPSKDTNAPYILTSTRALDSAGRRVHTYGIGIRLHLTPSEVLSAGNTLLGPLGVGSAAGVGAVGRWSADGKSREVEGKLRRWVDVWGESNSGLPTPIKTPRDDEEYSSIPPIPFAELPQLPQSSGNLLPAFALSSEGIKPLVSKKQPSLAVSPVDEDVFGPVVALPKSIGLKGAAKPGSVEERRQALYERIKARSNNVNVNLPSTGGRLAMANVSAAEAQNVLKRRSTLSRLEGVAESVWMLFSMSTPSGVTSSPGNSPRARRRAFPMSEVAEIVVKSSKSPISSAEARDSLLLLTQLCPFFLTPRTVARQEWLEMPAGSQQVERMTISPGGKLVGPTSPGKVVRGGLREVRERIRRELGE